MADNISTLYAKAVAEAQKAAQHVLDNAPGAYEKGKEAALIAAAKVQPALDSAIEKTPVLIGRSRIAAQQLYQDAPRHLTTAKVVAEQLYQDASRHFNAAKVAGLNAFENPSHSAKSFLDILRPIVRQNPYSCIFGVWAALAVIFGPLWPVRALLRMFGFGKGITPGKSHLIPFITKQVLTRMQDQTRQLGSPDKEMYNANHGSLYSSHTEIG